MRLHGGGLGGGILHLEPWKIYSDSLWIWASLSIGALVVPRGTWCWGLVYRETLKGGWSQAPYGGALRYVKQSSEMGVFFCRGPTFGEYGWAFLSWAFILEELLLGLLEIRKCLADEYFSPYRPHWRTWRGFICGDFWEKRSSTSGFLSWTQRLLRIYVWGPQFLWSDMGQKGPVY